MLNNGLFHKLEVSLTGDGGGNSNVAVRLIEDVNGAAIEHSVVNGVANGLDPQTFAGRVIVGGRTGGAFVETQIDCIQIEAINGN